MGYILDPQEIHEAINAADDALQALRQAQSCLASAGNWGIFDMLGGGFFSSLFKHSKLDQAQRALEDARSALQRFRRELADLNHAADFDLDVGDFLRFADFFFDGLIADWMVQSKIRKGEKQVQQAIAHVSSLRAQLWDMLS